LFFVADQLHKTSELQAALNQLGFRIDELKEFADDLLKSNQPSIDAFLFYRDDYAHIGRHAMAAALILREDERQLLRGDQEKWYEHLFARLFCRKELFPARQIEVLTFNYDRSFERSLELALRSCYGLSQLEASIMRDRIPVHHIYGDLGSLCEDDEQDYRPYSSQLDKWQIRKAAKRICLLGEERSDSERISRAREMVANATRIAFLGFAFHPLNVEPLAISTNGSRRMHATVFNTSQNEYYRIQNQFNGHVTLHKCDCLELLRNVNILE
jgi:hypothetical protein